MLEGQRYSICLSTPLCGSGPEPCDLHCETPCSLASVLINQWRAPACGRWEGGGERYQGICTPGPFLKGHPRLQGHTMPHRSVRQPSPHRGPPFLIFQELLPPFVPSQPTLPAIQLPGFLMSLHTAHPSCNCPIGVCMCFLPVPGQSIIIPQSPLQWIGRPLAMLFGFVSKSFSPQRKGRRSVASTWPSIPRAESNLTFPYVSSVR